MGSYNDDTDLGSAAYDLLKKATGYKEPTAEDLYGAEIARRDLPRNDPRHATLGPQSHRQMAREVVGSNPAMAAPYAVFIPAYSAAKALGLTKARSPASFSEMSQSYKGIGQGLQDWVMQKLKR